MNKNRKDARFPALTIAEAESILERWEEPHRRWHGLKHFLYLIGCVHEEPGLTESDREMLRYVALFHDAVYVPPSSDNEERSAQMAAYYLHEYPRRDEVVAAILATKTHQSQDPLAQKFNSWDCAILRETDWKKLVWYEDCIASEYRGVERKTYLQGRAKFLRQAALDFDNPLLAKLAEELEVPPFWSARILRENGILPR